MRRNIIVDWESTDDTIWLLRINRMLGGKNIFLVFHIDGWEQNSDERDYKSIRKLGLAHLVVTISEFASRKLRKMVRCCDIEIIRPGVEKVRCPSSKRSLVKDGRTALLFVGSVIERKGLETLIEAVSKLDRSTFILFLVGNTADRQYLERLRSMIATYGMEDVVRFMGRVDMSILRDFYCNADVFVFPSLMEGYGIALAEAIAAGLPSVATRAGAIPELVTDGCNGFLFDAGSPEQLSSALAKLIDDLSLREKMGRESRKIGDCLSSWEDFGTIAGPAFIGYLDSKSQRIKACSVESCESRIV